MPRPDGSPENTALDPRAIDPHAVSGIEELPDPPERMWARGTLPDRLCVAIVGTRRADQPSRAFAHRLARELVEMGLGVVSGGAEGIDAAAHEGALEAGGKTWVVLPTPIERPYPSRHRRLFQCVLDGGGGWVSERAPGEGSHKGHFLSRNRIIAAAAGAVVVVQAPLRSGALSTARWAERLDRPLFVVPASPWDVRAAGGLRLLAKGVRACTCAADLARPLGVKPPRRRRDRRPAPPKLEGSQRAVFAALGPQPVLVHEIVERTGLAVAQVRVALIQLASRGVVEQRAGGWLLPP